PAEERVAVGLVHGLHGLQGAVRVEVLSDEPKRFAPGSVLFVEGDERPLTIEWTGQAKPGLLVRFAELPTRESAEHLRQRYLEVPQEALPEGRYYWHQIEGLAVTTTAGDPLGTVADVFRAGENEVYVVTGGPLGEVMVPSVASVVVELDPEAGRLVVDPVALDLPAKPPRRRRRHEVTRRSRRAAPSTRARDRGAGDAG
ncbi:MAG: ribosome maturation factor RimM, partial [Candidatus Limnocylindrales bacterium]